MKSRSPVVRCRDAAGRAVVAMLVAAGAAGTAGVAALK